MLNKVNKAKYFNVIFDETTNTSKFRYDISSQLVIIIRYVYDKTINKDFIRPLDCHQNNYDQPSVNTERKMIGEIIGKTVIYILDNLVLPMNKRIGKNTGGCFVMQSEKYGANYVYKLEYNSL